MLLRKSYTVAFKLECINYAKENGNRVTARQYSINESRVHSYCKQEEALQLKNKQEDAHNKKSKKDRWPILDDEVESWVLEQTASHQGANIVHAKKAAATENQNNGVLDFEEKHQFFRKYCKTKIRDHRVSP